MMLWNYKAQDSTPEQYLPLGIIRKKENNIFKMAVRMNDINDKRVKNQTGFPTLLALLGYIVILCDSDIDEMTTSGTTLTWFEEWFLFFEIVYGKSVSRWVDVCDKYGLSNACLRPVYKRKLEQVLKVREIWPRYVTMQEDKTYRKQEKWEPYEDKRVIMFDNTNIMVRVPSNADAQRCTYSLYYSGNVGKGALFIHPCGWMGSHEVWSGGVSDSMYMTKGNVFDSLNDFIQRYETDEEARKTTFTIILDRGYRIVTEAFSEGGHFTLQPIFAEADNHFKTFETYISSSIATDRSGNQRAVRYLEISDYVKKGLITNESVDCLCDTWLAWGFQVNFMYKPVH
jgi:hypothetical protein